MQSCTRTLLRLGTFERYSTLARLRHRRIIRQTMSSHAFDRAYVHGDVFFLDEFADRQWDDPNFSGTRFSCDRKAFVDRVHQVAEKQGPSGLVEGYAPFCKHVFVPNEYDDVTVSAVAITDENRRLLETTYARRRPEEFAVLTRYFPADKVTAPRAAWLDVILYSREQLVKEHAALHGVSEEQVDAALPQAAWGIISIKAQSESFETPMNPITMMRNALGKAEGGSGVPLVRAEYDKAVEYWSLHAMIQ
mmetsp:Transcript_12985/g.37348  ORF Transcript_12985/g.37348 Transcript_12985/m.37348 type:complete len:249 (-) Transcript_12985:1700-2446(-)